MQQPNMWHTSFGPFCSRILRISAASFLHLSVVHFEISEARSTILSLLNTTVCLHAAHWKLVKGLVGVFPKPARLADITRPTSLSQRECRIFISVSYWASSVFWGHSLDRMQFSRMGMSNYEHLPARQATTTNCTTTTLLDNIFILQGCLCVCLTVTID